VATSKKPIPLLVRAKEATPPSTRTGGRLLSEISALPGVEDDLLFLLERPGDNMAYKGTFLQLKEAVLSKSYGLMQAVDGDTSSPLMTQGSITATPVLLTAWNTDGLSSSDMTPSASTGKITTTTAGIYEIDLSISFSGTLSKTFVFEIYQDDVSASPTPTATGFKMVRKLGTGGDVGSASLTGLISLAANDSIMIYISSSDGGTGITVHQSQLLVAQL
jgi:hypothetical protein